MICLILLLLCATVYGQCINHQMKTDKRTRSVYQCIHNKWVFHGRMMRPKASPPQKALISNHCRNNPDLNHDIAGFTCDSKLDMNVLDCINTKIAYICHNNAWSVYMIRN